MDMCKKLKSVKQNILKILKVVGKAKITVKRQRRTFHPQKIAKANQMVKQAIANCHGAMSMSNLII